MSQKPPDLPEDSPRDNTGWAQPPAPEGPPGAFQDRHPVSSGQPLPPGAGSPMQPGPPVSVEAPIPASRFNLAAVALLAGIVVLVLVVIVLVIVIVGAATHAAHS